MMQSQEKKDFIKEFALSENDCGSTPVQIALLSLRISAISGHLKIFKKDFHSQQGLVKLVARRKTFLRYLKKQNPVQHDSVVASLKQKGYL